MNPIAQVFFELFFPQDNACLICSRSLYGSEHLLCQKCAGKLCRLECSPEDQAECSEEADACLSAYFHDEEAADLIHQLKYGHTAIAAEVLTARMTELLLQADFAEDVDAVVPVPVHRGRLRERGYNQAECLAAPLAEALGKPLLSKGLIRMDQGRSQVGKNREERLKNLEKRFRADPTQLVGLNLLLVDDVLTTGATTETCVRELKNAGANRVWVITACRA